MNRRQSLLIIIVFLALAAWRFWPRPPTEQQRIRNGIESARQAVEKGSVRDLMRFIADDYKDNEGNTRDTLRQIATVYMLQRPQVAVGAQVQKVQVVSDTRATDLTAVAQLHLTIVDRGSGGRTDMDLHLDLRKDGGDWKVTRASGVRTTGGEP